MLSLLSFVVLVKGLLSGVVVGRGIKLTVVVLGSEVGKNGSSNTGEVPHVDFVGLVRVKVVLEVLEHVHVVLDEVVPAHSDEGEGFVHQFPSVNLWQFSDVELLGNLDGVLPVSLIESS